MTVTTEDHRPLLLTEDMQHGFTWRGVSVLTPYRTPSHPLLSSLLR